MALNFSKMTYMRDLYIYSDYLFVKKKSFFIASNYYTQDELNIIRNISLIKD